MTSTAPTLLPVALRLEGRRCLVVGGGRVAARKALDLVACGAKVTVVALAVGPEMAALGAGAGDLEIHERAYVTEDVKRRAVVVTATGVAEVDAAVAADARTMGVWVNAADDPGHCDFYLTSVHRSGPITVSVSSSGTSPALARWLRRRLADDVGEEFGRLALLLEECRHGLQARGRSTEGLDWDDLLSDELVDAVRRGDTAAARSMIERWAAIAT